MALAEEAYRAGDYLGALARLMPLARKGTAAAQARIGLLYRDGQGLPADRVRALMWLRLAADGGDQAAERAAADLAQMMTDSQRDEAAQMATRFRPGG